MQTKSYNMDMIHSEDEVLHGLQHLLMGGEEVTDNNNNYFDDDDSATNLQGYETMTLYRNVRKKYSSTPKEIKEGLHCIETFRTPRQGLEAALRCALCREGPDREASALYVAINPRHVLQGMNLTQDAYNNWSNAKLGMSKEVVKGLDRIDYVGTLDKSLKSNILKSQARRNLDMIDVDDADPTTWLKRVREAIGYEHIEMILETKNGYHVLYKGKNMKKHQHQKLQNSTSRQSREKVSWKKFLETREKQ